MFLNQRHHKIFTTLSVTVPQSLQTMASNAQSVHSLIQTYFFLDTDKRNTEHNLLCLSVTDPNLPAVYLFLF